MITEQDLGVVEKVGIGSQSNFGIAATAHAFNILSNSLYSNKPLALVRELVCNAWDAHEEKGNLDQPFDVHFPNSLEPHFSVRDYGYGISPEFMMDGYTKAFHSTKTNTNNQIGGFGLGRLSAFAYTDSYTAISIYQGVKRSYIIFKESGLPTITLVGEVETTEPDGFQVTVSVSQKDFFYFEQAGETFFRYLDIPVNIQGRTAFPKPQFTISGNGWRKWSAVSGSSCVKNGLVHYPLDPTIIKSPLTKAAIVIDLPIGSIEIAPSREALSYSESTKKAIHDKLDEVLAELSKSFQDELDKQKTKWDAKVAYHKFKTDSSELFALVSNNLKYKGQNEDGLFEINYPISFERVGRRYSRGSYQVYHGSILNKDYQNSLGFTKGHYKPSPDDLLIYNDLPDHLERRLTKISNNNLNRNIYLISNTPALFDDLFEKSDFPKLSEFDYDPIVKKPRTKSPLSGLKVMVWDRRKNAFSDGSFDDSKQFYYISCQKTLTKHRSDIITALENLKAFGWENADFQLIWVSPTQLSKISSSPNSTEFLSWADRTLKLCASTASKDYVVVNTGSNFSEFECFFRKAAAMKVDIPIITSVMTEYKKLASANCPFPLIELSKFYGHEIPVDDSISKAIEDILESKPLLRLIFSHYFFTLPDPASPRDIKSFEQIKQYIES